MEETRTFEMNGERPIRSGEASVFRRGGVRLISESGAFDHGQVVTVILRRNRPSLHSGILPRAD